MSQNLRPSAISKATANRAIRLSKQRGTWASLLRQGGYTR